jgi:hypothetical protein
VRLFGLGIEDNRTFLFSQERRTDLRKDDSKCNGEEVKMDYVRSRDGKRKTGRRLVLFYLRSGVTAFSAGKTLHGASLLTGMDTSCLWGS